MATPFPSPPELCMGTSLQKESGFEVDYTDDGYTRVRQVFDADVYRITAVWDGMTIDERDALEWFLRNNATEELSLSYGGHTYTVRLISDMQETLRSFNLYRITVTLRGTRDE